MLREGCHSHKYHYKAIPPPDDWLLETLLVDPTRETIASGGLIFKLRGRLTYRDGFGQGACE